MLTYLPRVCFLTFEKNKMPKVKKFSVYRLPLPLIERKDTRECVPTTGEDKNPSLAEKN